MTISTPDKPVRLRTPADIIDAVPYLVGFPPENSLVAIALSGEHNRSGVVARADLPEPQCAAELAEQAVGYLQRDGAERVLLVFYPPSGGPAHPSVRPIAETMRERLPAAGIDIADMLCVGEGRWWSLVCTSDCCPVDGTPIDEQRVSALAVAAAVRGQVPLASRAELVRTIEPLGGLAAEAMRYALPRAQAARRARLDEGGCLELRAESIDLLATAVSARLPGEGMDAAPLTVDEAARMIVGFDDVIVRDEVIEWCEGDWGEAARSLLTELVRRAVPPFDLAVLTALGWLSYLQGDGALAGIVVDRILANGPGNGMVRILDQALTAALPPTTFRAALQPSWPSGMPAGSTTPRPRPNPGAVPRSTRSQRRRRR